MRLKKILGVFPMDPATGWRFRVMVELECTGAADAARVPGYGDGRAVVADVLCGNGRMAMGSTGVAGTRHSFRGKRAWKGVLPAVREYLDRKGIIL